MKPIWWWPLFLVSAPGFAREVSEIVKTRELRVCLAPADLVLPAGCKDKCTFTGKDLLKIMLSKMLATKIDKKVTAKISLISWDEQFMNSEGKVLRDVEDIPKLLANGKCDVFPNDITRNPWREKKITLVDVFPSRMIVLVRAENKQDFRDEKSLAGKTVANTKDTSFHTWVDKANKELFSAKPILMKDYELGERATAVLHGEADFVIEDANSAFFASNKFAKKIIAAFSVGSLEKIGWGFRKSDVKLVEMATNLVAEEVGNTKGEFASIWLRTYGVTYSEYLMLVNAVK